MYTTLSSSSSSFLSRFIRTLGQCVEELWPIVEPVLWTAATVSVINTLDDEFFGGFLASRSGYVEYWQTMTGVRPEWIPTDYNRNWHMIRLTSHPAVRWIKKPILMTLVYALFPFTFFWYRYRHSYWYGSVYAILGMNTCCSGNCSCC